MSMPHFTKTHHTTGYPAIDPTRPELSAAGKTVLVTGGGTGIGFFAAQAFAKAGAAELILVGRRADVLERAKAEISAAHPGTRVRTSVADIADARAVDALFADSTGIDVMVSCAADLGPLAPFARADFDAWWRGFEVNIRGPALLARGFLRVAKPGAALVNVSSAAVHFPYMPQMSCYQASKTGALKFFECLQAEHPEVQIVSLHPGVVNTDMSREMYASGINYGAMDDGAVWCGRCRMLNSSQQVSRPAPSCGLRARKPRS